MHLTHDRWASRLVPSSLGILMIFVLLGSDPSPASASGSQTITLIAAGSPQFLPATKDCPDGLVLGTLTSPEGLNVGVIQSCDQSETQISRGAESHVINTNITFSIATGQVKSNVDLTEIGSWDKSHEILTYDVTLKGTVTGGNGSFAGRTGTVSGYGTCVVNFVDGSVVCDDTFIVSLA